jgi:hypothetical protein
MVGVSGERRIPEALRHFVTGLPHLTFAMRERGTWPYGESFTRLTRQSLPEADGDKLLPRNAGKSNEVSESQSPRDKMSGLTSREATNPISRWLQERRSLPEKLAGQSASDR